MAGVLVDSNVLLDVITEDPQWFSWSADALDHAANGARLVVNAVVFAEVAVRYSRIADLEAVIPAGIIDREAIPFEAAFLASRAFLAYRRRGGTKRSPLPDFFIGAHAAVAGYRLLTRDRARYGTYFPNVSLITPE